jgi:histidinol-phosphate aminotransferase
VGASPKAIKAYRDAAKKIALYPDGSARLLREAIGEAHGLDPARIVTGGGSDELLHLLAQTYLGQGDEAVVSQYGFLVYPIVTLGAGATPVVAPERDYRTDVDAVLAAVTPKTKIVFIANPNNPTGSYVSGDELSRLQRNLPPEVLLVIDSAYAEYATAADYDAGASLVDVAENVVMVRTFSKMGLAALRVGWLYGRAELVDALNRLRGPFNVSIPAQFAAAAAVRDKAFTRRLRAHNARWRKWLTANLKRNWMRVLPSEGNFVLVLFGDEPGHTAAEANAALLAQGLIARETGAYGLPNALRISIGSEEAMRRVAKILNGMGRNG